MLLFTHGAFAQSDLTEEIQFGENPGNLEMYLHASKSKEESDQKRPLVVALHGCSQNGKAISKTSEWNKLADKNDFVVLYPSQKRSNNVSNCFNRFESDDITKDSGELQSIINMIDYTVKKYNVDTSQIYVYGVSAGAAMGVSLLAVYPSYFKAGAIFAGAPYKIAINKREAAKVMFNTVDKSPQEWGELVSTDSIQPSYPKLIVYHGTRDKIVNIKNSNELIEQWTYLHQIDTIPDNIVANYKSTSLDRIAYTDTLGTEKILFYKFYKLGHAIPIDPGTGELQGGKPGPFAKDVDFYSTYYVAKDFGLIKD